MVHSPEGDINLFDIVAGILQGDTIFVYNLLRLSTSNIDRSN